jgi:hypothetical protein
MVDTSGQSTSLSVGEAAPSQKRGVAPGRAFWINPGFVWNKWQMQHQGSDRYTVSQRIMLFLLIGSHGSQRARLADNDALLIPFRPGLNELGTSTRRRVLLEVLANTDGSTAVATELSFKLQARPCAGPRASAGTC